MNACFKISPWLKLAMAAIALTCGAGAVPRIAQANMPFTAGKSTELFKAYEVDFAAGKLLPTRLDAPGIASAAAAANDKGTAITMTESGTWRGFWPVGSQPPFSGYVPLNGGERLHVSYTFKTTGTAPGEAILSYQYLGGETVKLGDESLIADGKPHTVSAYLPADASSRQICALWLQLSNNAPASSEFVVHKFWWERPRINNRLNADLILKTPPPHTARVAKVNGQMALTLDGKPITGLGWAPMISQNVGDAELGDMVGKSGFKLARLVMPLGTSLLGFYPPNWLGPDQFDFRFLDQQMARIQKANPGTRVILDIALDGAQWWVWKNPGAAGIDAAHGIPDYLSPEWRRDSRDALRQMVAHIQTSPYAGMVIGYQLFNGWTMDTFFEINTETPPALRRYREHLRRKYKTDAALRTAWRNPKAALASATAVISPGDYQKAFHTPGASALLFEPIRNLELADKLAYRNHVWQQVLINFARDIKEATQNRALTGARAGDFLGHSEWVWPQPLSGHVAIDELLASPYFDMFEVQEPYVGRGIGDYGSGAPVAPPQGLAARNKILIIQNDVRTHLSSPDEGYGRTPDLASTLQMQRRIFANSLVRGTPQYLWQMSYSYNAPEMLQDFRQMEQIALKAYQTDGSTGAEIAFVFDKNYRKYFGYDPLKTEPSRGFALFDYLKFSWARAGVPYDMIFLDDLPKARPYKVYVFVHTVGLTDAQRDLIKRVTRRDKRVGIYLWADGAIDGHKFNDKKMSDLVGMEIGRSMQEATWKMSPTDWFQKRAGVGSSYLMGTMPSGASVPPGTVPPSIPLSDKSDPKSAENTYAPSFWVSDKTAHPLANYDNDNPLAGKASIAMRQTKDYTSIYSASPILSPALLRFALQQAGAFIYTDTPDNCYINNSFVGINAQTIAPHAVQVRLPAPSALYEVFRNQELARSDRFSIPVEPGQTYLYFRGSKEEWQRLKPQE